MAKPILVTRIPKDATTVSEELIYAHLKKVAPDYNHIALIESGIKKVIFEVFNVQDYKPIDLEKLKHEISNYRKP